MKTHLNLATTDLEKSIAFYSTLLNAKPRKALADYALFVTDEPGLELALDLSAESPSTRGVHFGVFVETAEEVESAIARLKDRDLVSSVERQETCCYANQTKVWATDPDGRRWEVYTVHEDTEDRDSEATTCCVDESQERSCCSA